MYSLRSVKSASKSRDSSAQTTIDFRRRKRASTSIKEGQPSEDVLEVNKSSPPKRTKSLQESVPPPTFTRTPVTRHSTRKMAEAATRSTRSTSTPHRKAPHPLTAFISPLKPNNTPVKSPVKPCDLTPTTTPCHVTPRKSPKSTVRRLRFTESSSAYEVKRSLHNSRPESLLCRDDQLSSLNSFMTSHLHKGTSGALYISGAPGTGKTACLSTVLEKSCDLIDHTHIVTINCMSVEQPQAIYSRIATALLGSKVGKTKSSSVLQQELVKHITKHRTLIVLDEVDQLDCRGQEVLYTIFEWPALPGSKLLLIGIANALDLTDRVLPRLQSHVRCKPQLLHFPPYNREQIVTILQSRVGGAGLIEPMAVQFCARKVASVHGDVRKALDICRRAIEKAELDKENEATPLPLRITLRHVADVIAEVYGSGVSVGETTFPLQQKLAVCTLLCMVRGRARKETSLGKLYDSYVKVCRHRRLRSEGESVFVGLCDMLETRGIIVTKTTKDRRDSKVTLKLEEAELEHILQDKLLITSVLEHGVPRPA
ncbi:cell division control protein 6 homolog isoform X2 [Halichondria panicea]|uniref:cell division control protein 6 homolog isoform X2 n=1 Tax=Halichondria panicea TaxID=6063 RepID=UPI00312B989E